ncbi:uncharacterized protein LOC108861916 isoform X1 [Raphanus sativus]|uniref:Uncharacterized protein LOC108861916 isoform X1 n=1 Tax=Raphanus sativus TaxID=3726 RepID=A0A9W3DTG9_RAPSA|nr:uncharacterized protein LOC108861916 isoform X1 [Raphanus sativus]
MSAIIRLRHGYFASLLFKRHWSLTEVEEKCGGNSSATSSTAVGFAEIMLLHSECFCKSSRWSTFQSMLTLLISQASFSAGLSLPVTFQGSACKT